MSSDYVIRFATEADVDEIAHHRRAMFEDMGFTDARALDAMEETTRAFIANSLKTGSYLGWLAEGADGTILAGVGLIVCPWISNPRSPQLTHLAYVLNMYVDPAHRRQGLARRLMNSVLEWCKEKGFPLVSLHASDQGRSLYESLGFKPTNEMRLVVPSNRVANGPD